MCLPPDGWGEVGVDGSSQPVVVILLGWEAAAAEIDGLHHAPRGHDAQHRVEVRVVGKHGPV